MGSIDSPNTIQIARDAIMARFGLDFCLYQIGFQIAISRSKAAASSTYPAKNE